MADFFLASASPRRRDLLRQVGARFETLLLRVAQPRGPDVLEVAAPGEEGAPTSRVSVSRVWIRALDEGEIARYCASREPLGKAGAYALQGRGAAFVERIEGSCSGVVGLPLSQTVELLAGAGILLP